MKDDLDGKLVPFCAIANSASADSAPTVRLLTKELYTQIQCRVMEDKYWRQVESVRASGGHPSPLLVQKLKDLNRCKTLPEFSNWLQAQSGRAMLVCNACLTMDVDEVLEIKEHGDRRRICSACCEKLGLQEMYAGAKSALYSKPVVRQRDPVAALKGKIIDVEVADDE